jgi:hypothetical protein
MGLLMRTNPRATPGSVIRWALVGGAIGLAFALVTFSRLRNDPRSRSVIIAAVIVGACTGAVLEWRHEDRPEEGCEEGEEGCD